ncbi:MAG: VOC family protein [Acidobacteriota bacterium]
MDIRAELDHLVWAAPDLERGMLEIEERLGAVPVVGGRHPGVGTRNALVEIGGRRYLEILAPDPEQHSFSGFVHWVTDLAAPRLVTWASRTPDLDAWVRAAGERSLAPEEPRAMERRRPDGSRLAWRLAGLGEHRDGLLPFCIEWGDDHPADSLPTSGCHLLQLSLGDDAGLRDDLAALGLAEDPALFFSPVRSEPVAIFDTPRGRVELT